MLPPVLLIGSIPHPRWAIIQKSVRMDKPKGEITLLLKRVSGGDSLAEEALMESVYVELHRLALTRLKSERGGHTLQATALVHEAYLRLCQTEGISWEDRSHFFRVAARIMRRILVDYARQRGAKKRNDGMTPVSIDSAIAISSEESQHAIDVDEMLVRLAELNVRQAQVVEMRFFGGLTEKEIASTLGVDLKTVGRDWAKARAWLYGQLEPKAGRTNSGRRGTRS
jgi:RNA polymerase sigma-70 factor (ECF subfamily)